jgi:hypothetical protein
MNQREDYSMVTGCVHLNEAKVKPAGNPKRGNIIGLSGGALPEPYGGQHLHFTVGSMLSLSP